jgi:hypothetical protein
MHARIDKNATETLFTFSQAKATAWALNTDPEDDWVYKIVHAGGSYYKIEAYDADGDKVGTL